MRILLDTHIWLWMNQAPQKIGKQARLALETYENELFLSAASVWEIAIKHKLGKLVLPIEPSVYVSERIESNGVKPLSIESAHVLASARLPDYHQDPFDRLIVA